MNGHCAGLFLASPAQLACRHNPVNCDCDDAASGARMRQKP